MQAIFERSRHAEIAAAAAQAPEQVGVLVLAGRQRPSVREHQVDGKQVVERQRMLAHQPTKATAERQARQACRGDHTACRRQPI